MAIDLGRKGAAVLNKSMARLSRDTYRAGVFGAFSVPTGQPGPRTGPPAARRTRRISPAITGARWRRLLGEQDVSQEGTFRKRRGASGRLDPSPVRLVHPIAKAHELRRGQPTSITVRPRMTTGSARRVRCKRLLPHRASSPRSSSMFGESGQRGQLHAGLGEPPASGLKPDRCRLGH